MTSAADMSWFWNGLLRLFMSREACEKMDAYHAAQRRQPRGEALRTVSPEPAPPGPQSDKDLVEAVDAAVTRIALAEGLDRTEGLPRQREGASPPVGRAELIRRAMALHKEKQSVLAELDDQTRRKLAAAAMQAFFNGKSKT
ncbi:hypothetical protein [Oleispirillum naphthae]|uniref:hypothetical protein n=1 Tax=Oleispirillum naphthae TaxID=2838853 RepID=UPI00308242FF